MSQEDKAWLIDSDNDGVGDSLQFYAPDCKLTLEECLAIAKVNRDEFIIEIEKMNSYRPMFSVDSGTHNTPLSLELSTEVEGARIYYTLNGDSASKQTDQYVSPISINKTTTVTAVVYDENGEQLSTQSIYVFTIDLEGKAMPPEFAPEQGTYNVPPNITLGTLTSGAVIRYTLDGTVPTELSPGYSVPIEIDRTTTIRAKTIAPDLDPSETITREYKLEVAKPVADVDSGTHTETQYVSLSTISPMATIRYTEDGSEPDANSKQAIGPIEISSSTILKAKGFRAGWISSQTLVNNYVIQVQGRTADPVIFPFNGPFSRAVEVEITCATDGATIHYTLDGSQPTNESPVYSDKIMVNGNMLVTAIAYHPDLDESGTVQVLYSFNVKEPVITGEPGNGGQEYTIDISTTTADAEIYYTMDGSDPGITSAKYNAPLKITQSTNIRARAYKENWLPSGISTESFFITREGAVASPLITPEFARKEGSQLVSMSVGTDDAQIYYTTNGTDPTQNSTLYEGEFIVNKSMQIKAKAYADGLDPSTLSLATYYILAYAPEIEPGGGTFLEPIYVKLTSQTKGARIFYTTDGQDPDTTSALYEDSILVNTNMTLKAIAVFDGLEVSNPANETYVIQNSKVSAPVFSPLPGSFLTPQTLSLETNTQGAEILYTVDGTDPTDANASPLVYDSTSPPQISSNTQIKAVAVKDNWTSSDVVEGNFEIAEPGTATLISPNGGEKWVVGSNHNISWATSQGVDKVDLSYYSASTGNVVIASGIDNSGSYSWTVPAPAGNDFRVVVSIPSQGSDTSDANFEILALQAVNRFEWANYASSSELAEGISPVMDPQGNTLLAGRYNGSIVFPAGDADIQLNSGNNDQLFLAKFDKDGNCLWAVDAGSQYIHDISLTSQGNIIVAGYHSSTFFEGSLVPVYGGDDGFVASYSSSGQLDWVRKMGGLGDDYAYGLSTDPQGNVYVCGVFDGSSSELNFGGKLVSSFGNADMFIMKYSPTGTALWAKTFGGEENDYANSLSVDDNGLVWVVGAFASPDVDFDNISTLEGNGNLDAFILRLESNGNVNSALSFGNSGDDEATDISLSPNNEVLVAGIFTNSVVLPGNHSLNTSQGSVGIFGLSLSLSGEVNWTNFVSSTSDLLYPVISAAGNGMAYLAATGSGNANFNGDTTLSLGSQDLGFVAKISNTGNYLWVETVAGAEINDINGGPNGEAVFTGYYSNRAINFGNKSLPEATNSSFMFLTKIGSLDVSPGNPNGL